MIPRVIDQALSAGAALALSISGGKDGQAMVAMVMRQRQARRWPGPVFAIHADTGRTEWPQTAAHCQKIAADAGIELITVRRAKGDLVDRWRQRMEKLAGTGKPFWSSSANRYCTAELKRDPINTYLRRFDHVVSAEGIRAQESRDRALQPVWEYRDRISNLSRQAWTWRPVHHYTLDDVWAEGGTDQTELSIRRAMYRDGRHAEALAGWPFHPAYVLGNDRLSCALCVLASRNDLINGIRHNPGHFRELVVLERESGCTFRSDTSLEQLGIEAGVKVA